MNIKTLEGFIINYYTQEKGIYDEDIINNNFEKILLIAESIRKNLTYKNGVYYSVNELFLDRDIENELKPFIIAALKLLDVEFIEEDTLYRICKK